MQTMAISMPTQPFGSILRFLGDFVESFNWALAVRNECDRVEKSGRLLDGDAINRIIADLNPTANAGS